LIDKIQETGFEHWETISKSSFEGQGSMGNGACMRVCPIGAFFYNDFEKIKLLTKKSAEITHYNTEAIAGATAIAIATALAIKFGLENNKNITFENFVDTILLHLPTCDTKIKIAKTKNVMPNYHIETIKTMLGNGTQMLVQDTVPFVIWCAGHYLYDFESALWKAVSILGDRDTICAMVGGITIMSSNSDKIPENWVNLVEDFEKSSFTNKS
jgi:ADP-ribosylglycohydrolase